MEPSEFSKQQALLDIAFDDPAMADSSSTEALLAEQQETDPLWTLPSEKTADTESLDAASSNRRRSSISTRLILQRFRKYVPLEDAKTKHAQWLEDQKLADEALARLTEATEPTTLRKALRNKMHIKPSQDELAALQQDWITATQFHAKARSRVKVYITDFGPHHANSFAVELKDIELYLDRRHGKGKPQWAQYRWIHAPIGRGLLQSTIEEFFNYTGSNQMGRPFTNSGTGGWPYPTIVTLSFWSQELLKAKTEAHKRLAVMDTLDNPAFSIDPLQGFTDRQKRDLKWRAQGFEKDISHWDMLEADFPSVLEQPFLSQNTPLDPRTTMAARKEEQALSLHEQFKGAILMTNDLRAFHRSDGYLMTFASPSGVNYLGDNFRTCLESDPETLLCDPEASVFGHAMEAFIDNGTSSWGHATLEWFIIYLFTEAAVTPHNIRHGYTTLSYLQGFVAVAKKLEHLHKPLVRGDRSKLVSRYVESVRNLKALYAQTQNQKRIIGKLRKDWEQFEKAYAEEGIEKSPHPDAESAIDRLVWADGLLSEHEECINRLLTHFQDSLNVVFQQQNIELNELAIVADSQNSAILIFTTVTIVFLPLSFLTSYFGMNLRGVVDTTHNQTFFWRICIAFATALLGLVFIVAYKKAVGERARIMGRNARNKLFASQGLPTLGGGAKKGDAAGVSEKFV